LFEAIDEHFKLIMIRPYISRSRMVTDAGSDLQIGTVVDFPEGKSAIDDKLVEAKRQFRTERMTWILSVIMRL
jgi:deoxyribose-phosphate aldolase